MCKWTSEATAKIHFILDYLALQTNLKVLKTNKKGKNTRTGGEWGKKGRGRGGERQTDRPETDYIQEHCAESQTEG